MVHRGNVLFSGDRDAHNSLDTASINSIVFTVVLSLNPGFLTQSPIRDVKIETSILGDFEIGLQTTGCLTRW
jgi:hypothetical protein